MISLITSSTTDPIGTTSVTSSTVGKSVIPLVHSVSIANQSEICFWLECNSTFRCGDFSCCSEIV
jgi:hypothetical protein